MNRSHQYRAESIFLEVLLRVEKKLDSVIEWTKLFEVQMMTEEQIRAQLDKQTHWPNGELIKRMDTKNPPTSEEARGFVD